VFPSIAGIAPVTAGVTDVPVVAPSAALSAAQQKHSERLQLTEIDRRFSEMLRQDSTTWNLDAIEAEYHMLQESVTQKSLSGTIDMRYPAIERYRRRLTKLNELRQLTSQTEQRDAALVAKSPHASSTRLAAAPNWSPGPESMAGVGQPTQLAEAFEEFVQNSRNGSSNVAIENESFVFQDAGDGSVSNIANPSSSPELITPGSPQNRFIGAGIVQRSTDSADGSAYVLMSPTGKVLAELKPTANVSLDNYVGQQVGVQGTRFSEQEKRDVIEVSSLEPVKLR
jgi:hypothetical protein